MRGTGRFSYASGSSVPGARRAPSLHWHAFSAQGESDTRLPTPGSPDLPTIACATGPAYPTHLKPPRPHRHERRSLALLWLAGRLARYGWRSGSGRSSRSRTPGNRWRETMCGTSTHDTAHQQEDKQDRHEVDGEECQPDQERDESLAKAKRRGERVADRLSRIPRAIGVGRDWSGSADWIEHDGHLLMILSQRGARGWPLIPRVSC